MLTFALAKGGVSLAIAEINESTPALIVSDHQEVADGQWGHAMQELAHKYPKYIKGNPALLVVLGPSLYQSVQLDRPKLPAAEISQALKYSLRDLVSLAPADIIADYYDSPVQLSGQDKINAIVADKTMLQGVLKAAQELSENICGIVAEEQAVSRLFTQLQEPSVVVYQHDIEPALLQVYQQGELQVNRLVRALEQISALSADEISLGGGSPLSIEVQRSADYFERQLRQRPIKQVVLAVGSKHRAALQQQVADDLGFEVQWAEYPLWAQELATADFADFPVLGGVMLARELLYPAEEQAA